MSLGCALMAAGCLLLLLINAGSGYGAVAWPFAIVRYGLTSTSMAAAVLGAVPAQRAGMASSTNLSARVAGGVFGIATLGALLPTTTGHADTNAFTSGLHTALIVAAAIGLAGAAAAAAWIREPRRRPEAQPDT